MSSELENMAAALRRAERRVIELEAKLAEAQRDAERMKASTYSHIDGRDLLHELQPNGAHHIDIVVRINGQDRRYQGDWLKALTWARDGHNMGEHADNPTLRAMIEQRRKDGLPETGAMSGSLSAIAAERKEGSSMADRKEWDLTEDELDAVAQGTPIERFSRDVATAAARKALEWAAKKLEDADLASYPDKRLWPSDCAELLRKELSGV